MPWGPLRIENEMNNEAKRESEPFLMSEWAPTAVFVWFLGQWALFGGVKGGSSRTATSPQRRRAAKEAKKWSWKQRLWVEWTKWRMNFIFVLMESMKMKWMKGMRVNETPPQGAKRSAVSLSLFRKLNSWNLWVMSAERHLRRKTFHSAASSTAPLHSFFGFHLSLLKKRRAAEGNQ